MNTSERITQLKTKLTEQLQKLKDLSQNIQGLENRHRSEISQKEKELEEWRNKLETFQQERNQIKKQIRDQVSELEKSNLENTEKQARINKLLTEHSQELEELDNLLYDERTQYRQIRDKIFEKLLKPCEACQEKDQHLKTLSDRVSNLKTWTILLLLAGIFHFFLFLYMVFRKKKKKQDAVVSVF